MGYIVDLTVIMDGIFRVVADDLSPKHTRQVLDGHIRSGRRDAIHRDIQSFVAEEQALSSLEPQKDLIFERIVDLIKQFCVPPSDEKVRF